MVIRVQIPHVPSYNEDQVTLQSTPQEWQLARVTRERMDQFYSFQGNLAEEGMVLMPTNTMKDPLDLDEKGLLKEKCKLLGFQSLVIRGRTFWTMMMGNRLNIMTQALYVEDIANLPKRIYIMQMYTELRDRSRSVAVVIRNMSTHPVCLLAGKVIAQVTAANEVLAAKPSPELLRKLEQEDPAIVESKLTIKQ